MKEVVNCACGRVAAWWVTGFATDPHPCCDECKDADATKDRFYQPLSAFEKLPTVAAAEAHMKGKAIW